MEKQKEVLKVLLKHYTKIGLNGGIAKVIFDDDFEDIAEEIVKLFAIPVVMQRSELLLFADYSESDKTSQTTDECVDNYLAQKQ